MTCGNAALFNIGLCLFALLPSCKREAKSMKEVNVTKPHTVEIVPGESIGDVKLGTKAENMPSRATIQRPAGVLDDIHFLINEDGVVDDTWIEDLRVFPHAVRCQGKTIPPDATIESLSVLLGQCDRVAGIKGGIFYNCAAGLALGTDFSRKTLQIRVKPISTKTE
jgi:hypothetical protein